MGDTLPRQLRVFWYMRINTPTLYSDVHDYALAMREYQSPYTRHRHTHWDAVVNPEFPAEMFYWGFEQTNNQAMFDWTLSSNLFPVPRHVHAFQVVVDDMMRQHLGYLPTTTHGSASSGGGGAFA